MQAMVLKAHNTPMVRVDDHPEPDGGAVLEVTACGVCHSDLHVADGMIGKAPPLILGHEVTGIHPQMGPVMVYAPWGCGKCKDCRGGVEMICADAAEAGIFADGGYAQRMGVPAESYLAPIGDLDPYRAAPLACGGLTAYRAVGQGLPRLRERGSQATALVIGAGGLGQFAIRFLRLQSEATVVALDLSEAKQRTAIEQGAHHATGTPEDLETFDLVIDFIGASTTLAVAAAHVAKRGTAVVVGLAGGQVGFGFGKVPHEARFMSSVWGSRSQLDELLAFAQREPGVLSDVEIVAFTDAQLAHDRLRSGEAKGRIVLDVRGDRCSRQGS